MVQVERCAFWNQVYESMSFSGDDLMALLGVGEESDVDTGGAGDDSGDGDLTDARDAPVATPLADPPAAATPVADPPAAATPVADPPAAH